MFGVESDRLAESRSEMKGSENLDELLGWCIC